MSKQSLKIHERPKQTWMLREFENSEFRRLAQFRLTVPVKNGNGRSKYIAISFNSAGSPAVTGVFLCDKYGEIDWSDEIWREENNFDRPYAEVIKDLGFELIDKKYEHQDTNQFA